MIKIVYSTFLTLLLIYTPATQVFAHEDDATPEEKAWLFRDGLFRVIHWKFGQMIAAKQTKDQSTFKNHANDIAYLSNMILEGFELKNSLPENSKAKKEIWENWQDFQDRTKSFQQNIHDLAASGNMDIFDPKKFGSTNCGSCHRKYKIRH